MMTFDRLLLSACLVALSPMAVAGEVPAAATGSADPAARPPGWLRVGPGYMHQFETDADSGGVSFSADRWRLDLGTRIPFSDALSVSIGAESEWSVYDFDGPVAAATGLGEDAEDLFVGQLGVLAMYDLNDTWQVMVGGTISWGGDFEASFSDGLGGSGLLGVTYRFSPRFSLSPGVLALARLEDDALVVPVLGVDWQITESWRLRSIGPGAELTWRANDQWTVFVRGLYRPRDFRLAPDAVVSSGVFRERAFPVSLGAEWSPTSRVTASAFGGVVLGGSVRLAGSDGEEILKEDTDVTPIVGGIVRILF